MPWFDVQKDLVGGLIEKWKKTSLAAHIVEIWQRSLKDEKVVPLASESPPDLPPGHAARKVTRRKTPTNRPAAVVQKALRKVCELDGANKACTPDKFEKVLQDFLDHMNDRIKEAMSSISSEEDTSAKREWQFFLKKYCSERIHHVQKLSKLVDDKATSGCCNDIRTVAKRYQSLYHRQIAKIEVSPRPQLLISDTFHRHGLQGLVRLLKKAMNQSMNQEPEIKGNRKARRARLQLAAPLEPATTPPQSALVEPTPTPAPSVDDGKGMADVTTRPNALERRKAKRLAKREAAKHTLQAAAGTAVGATAGAMPADAGVKTLLLPPAPVRPDRQESKSKPAPKPALVVVPQKFNTNACVVCLDKSRRFAAIPCGHMLFCEDCSERLADLNHSCPLCRGEIERVLRIWS